jgi:exodeoxyribonuclease III
MKITTWNVNGLRSALNKEAWGWVKGEAPDILCLQEIKVNPSQLTPESMALFDGYQVVWNPALRPGYSGVASFFRPHVFPPKGAAPVKTGIGEPRFDVEGRLVHSCHKDFHLFNVYFPNGQRDHNRLEYKLNFYAALLDLCDQPHAGGENIIICGDFNTAHREIDLKNPKQNETTSGFLPVERAWIDRYLERGFLDAYRELYPERVQYTWWTYRVNARGRNIGWRLDYFLVSQALLPRVQDVVVHDHVPGSDHCPVSLVLNVD